MCVIHLIPFIKYGDVKANGKLRDHRGRGIKRQKEITENVTKYSQFNLATEKTLKLNTWRIVIDIPDKK